MAGTSLTKCIEGKKVLEEMTIGSQIFLDYFQCVPKNEIRNLNNFWCYEAA